MTICHPPADWSARWTEAELDQQLDDPTMGPKIAIAEAYAWSLLAALTLYRIGTCPITVEPHVESCAPSGSYRASIAGGPPVYPIGRSFGHSRYPIAGCGCAVGRCGCSALSEVVLPGPVGSIVRVEIGGEALERSEYRVVAGNRLVRRDGTPWPRCDDTFLVTYYRGMAPNIMTRYAAGVLANEFLLGMEQDSSCRLPWNVVAASRAGESYEFDQKDFVEGNTGIPEVEALIRIFNPHGLKSPVIVASPDAPPVRMG